MKLARSWLLSFGYNPWVIGVWVGIESIQADSPVFHNDLVQTRAVGERLYRVMCVGLIAQWLMRLPPNHGVSNPILAKGYLYIVKGCNNKTSHAVPFQTWLATIVRSSVIHTHRIMILIISLLPYTLKVRHVESKDCYLSLCMHIQ